MCKAFLLSELRKITHYTDEELQKIIRKSLKVLAGYGGVILLTVCLQAVFSSWHILSVLFSFLLGLEVFILYTILSFCLFLVFIYYGAHFASKGWKRH